MSREETAESAVKASASASASENAENAGNEAAVKAENGEESFSETEAAAAPKTAVESATITAAAASDTDAARQDAKTEDGVGTEAADEGLLIRTVGKEEKAVIRRIAGIHAETFTGFFLTFMGEGFLTQLYTSFCSHPLSGLLAAEKDGETVGFLAYSADYSGLFKYMIKTRLIPFGWYSFCAFLRKPAVFLRLLRAFLKPGEVAREERYIELSSIGVAPDRKGSGIGSELIRDLFARVDFGEYEYISLETDADNNEGANAFYIKNGFTPVRQYVTREGRRMNEYRYYGEV